MKLLRYIGKGLVFCLMIPITLIKYLLKGIFAPVLLMNDSMQRKKMKQKKKTKTISEKKKEPVKKVDSKSKVQLPKSDKERLEAQKKEREATLKREEERKKEKAKRIKEEAKRKKQQEKLEKKRQKRLRKEAEKKRLLEKKEAKKREEAEKKRLENLKKIEEKQRLQAEKRQRELEAQERKQQEKLRKEEEKQQKMAEKKKKKLEAIERKKAIKKETKEEKKARKAREKIEKQEKAKLARQKKIEAIHDKQQRKENELYRKEKEKLEEKKRKEELKKKKKEAKRLAKEQRRKKSKESYINENVVIEKPGVKGAVAKFTDSIKAFPKKLAKKISNNSFSKSARNRRDMNRQALLIDFEGDDTKRSDIKLIYEYEAKTPEGKFVKGHFEAFSKVEVHSFLLSEGYEVYKIHTNRWIALKYARTASNKKKFKNKDLIFFLTQLSTYLKAGITLSEALKILARQFSSTKAYENIFKSINYELSIGESFSDTLDKQGNAFPKLLINMLKTAEMTGSLPEVLDDMAAYYTEMEESRRSLVTAMMYPSIVGIFAIAVITFIMVYVVPQFVEIYATMDGTEIPAFTKAVMALSDFLKENLVLIIIVLIVAIAIFYFIYKKNKFFRTIVQMAVMRMPVFGNTIIYSEVTTFTKTLGSLLSHNVPIIDCMDILNKITNNEIYKMLILDVITNLARGGKISESFEGQWAFPIPAYEMIVTGERTGELAEMMSKVSLYYQSLQKNAVARIKTFVEPALTVFLAGATGLIVLAIVIPMFNMYSAVSEM